MVNSYFCCAVFPNWLPRKTVCHLSFDITNKYAKILTKRMIAVRDLFWNHLISKDRFSASRKDVLASIVVCRRFEENSPMVFFYSRTVAWWWILREGVMELDTKVKLMPPPAIEAFMVQLGEAIPSH